MGEAEVGDIRAIVELGLPTRILTWGRACPEDLLAAERTGARGFHFSLPVSDLHLSIWRKRRNWVFAQLEHIADEARDRFEYFSVGAQDASRADPGFLRDFSSAAAEAGAARLRIADTVGRLHPLQTTDLIADLRATEPKLPIEFHGHNDLGMAVGNTVAAFLAGADCASVTVNGLGERAGNAPLEEVMIALRVSAGIELPYRTALLPELCDQVDRFSGRRRRIDKPIVGSGIWRHESGIHTSAQTTHRAAYEAFSSEALGIAPQPFVIGKHSGSAGLIARCRDLGIALDRAAARSVLPTIRDFANKQKRALTDDEIRAFCAPLMHPQAS